MTAKRPLPGLGVLVLNKNNEILLGKRSDCQLYGIPGGYLEKFETWEKGAARELKEEVDLDVDPEKIHVVQVFNALEEAKQYHNVAIILLCEYPEGQEVRTMEPDKCAGWEWWSMQDLENRIEEIFYPNRQVVVEYKHILDIDFMRKTLAKSNNAKSSFHPK